MNKGLIIFYILPLLFAANIVAQQNDAGAWLSLSIEKKFTQAWSAEFSHCSRFNENVSELGSIINELGVSYRLDKKSQFSVFYRINAKKQLDNMYVPISRIYLDYSYKHKPGPFVLTMRLRFQHQQKNTFFFDEDGKSKYAIRPKVALKYPIGNFSPFVSGEVYLPVFSNKYKPIDKIRLLTGVDYEFNNAHAVSLGYLFQREYFVGNPRTDYIIQIGYEFSF